MARVRDNLRVKTRKNEALVAGLRAREEGAFGELVQRCSSNLFAVAQRYLRNEEDARDAVQDTLLSVFRVIDQFEGTAQLSTWLYRITSNAALMKLRTRRRLPEESLEGHENETLEHGLPLEYGAYWREPIEVLNQRQEDCAFVHACIATLPEPYQNALMLRDINECNTQEVAEQLGVSANAAKLRVHRARRALRGVVQA